MKWQNLHTHTTFCDGKNTPVEMAKAAFVQGCGSLGFSAHSVLSFDPSWTLQQQDISAYRQQVLALRAQYAGKMDIFLGLEQDLCSDPPVGEWDYLIGSVHCLKRADRYVSVDLSPEALRHAVDILYGGDCLALAEDYYQRVAELPARTGCQIVGHLDLVTKFNEGGALFAEDHIRYRQAALAAVEQLTAKDMIFEINTGAISRGWRTAPYPADFLLRAVWEKGGRICLSSDAHSCDAVLFGLRDAAQLAIACGFREIAVLTGDGFQSAPLTDFAK